MSESRVLPLRLIAKPGRYGAQKGAPGVTFSIIHPVFLTTVIARNGKLKSVTKVLAAMDGLRVMWAGPEQFYVQSVKLVDLKAALGTSASVIDQSHGRVVIKLTGQKARAVLAKGTSVDLHTDQFQLGKSALTQMAHVGVHLTRTGQDEFMLSVFRGFSESIWEWLELSAAEFGYCVEV